MILVFERAAPILKQTKTNKPPPNLQILLSCFFSLQ